MMSSARRDPAPEWKTPSRLAIARPVAVPRLLRAEPARGPQTEGYADERPTRLREFVLVVALSGETMLDAADALARAGYSPVSTLDPDEAIADMHRFAFDALVLAARTAPSLRERIVGEYRALRPRGKVIEFEGAPGRLVESLNRALAP